MSVQASHQKIDQGSDGVLESHKDEANENTNITPAHGEGPRVHDMAHILHMSKLA